MQTAAPGSGGVIIPPAMQRLVDRPGYLTLDEGGQKLRNMYSHQAESFNPTLLSEFALSCYTGDLERVKMTVESGRAPDLIGTEGALRFGYATIVVSGKRGISRGPIPMQHAETLSYLLSHGCPSDVEDIAGLTALSHSTMHKASSPIDLARILLAAGADVNHRDRYGQVPIMNAFMTENLPSIELLMEFGADLDIGDADGVIPRQFFVGAGPRIAATVSKWLRKRSGEEGLLAEKQCGNCRSSGPETSLKLCSRCHSIKYCSTTCQRSHWPTHKKSCNPFSTENTVTLKPDYEFGGTIPIAAFKRNAMGIPTDPTPERHTRGPRAPKSSESKSMVIKVQVPQTLDGSSAPAGVGGLMIYNKKRDFNCQIKRVDTPAAYDRISQVVRSQGIGGGKAYFSAELVNKHELVVKVSEVLATQPW